MYSLPPATEHLWERLQAAGELKGFALIGGTALAMQLHHRTSEDLDFIQTLSGPLPRGRIRRLRARLEETGWVLRANPSPALVAEFDDSGLDWGDYQQDFVADDPAGGGVKLTFVVAEPENLRCLDADDARGDAPRLATVPELFRLKCIAAADRSKSRDWLDLFLLLRSRRFTPHDFIDAYDRAGVPQKREIALMRMTSGKLAATDEGFSALLARPPSLEEIRTYFETLEDDVQQILAARQFASPRPPS